MTMLKSADGSQYVLVLTEEQAELLGTLRFSHVAGGAALYYVLNGLPCKPGARFQITYDPNTGKPTFGAFIPAPDRVVHEDTTRRYLQAAGLMKGEATLRKDRKARKTGWIVQYDRGNPRGSWVSLVGTYGEGANRVYYSRNEAYRQMRKRAVNHGAPLSDYRVVPDGTKDGPERDRGYYVIEYFRKVDQPLGWGRSEISALRGTFSDVESAWIVVNRYVPISERSRYRIRWRSRT